MADAPVNVNFNASPPDTNPERVICTNGVESGIRWTGNKQNYTFTNLYIGGLPVAGGGVGDFTNLTITAVGPLSVMRVDNACIIPPGAEYVEYKYTLEYTDPSGASITLDPRIRNRK
jgi:hypothetical protein